MRTTNERHEKDAGVREQQTALVYRLALKKRKYFLSRPNRSGRSRLLLTFASLFHDGIEDFRGLAIEKLLEQSNNVTLQHSGKMSHSGNAL